MLVSIDDRRLATTSKKFPSQKVSEIDNRGSTYYHVLAWAKALAAQHEDDDLKQPWTRVGAAL
jgi:isocitrate dehydrogenase